MKSYAPQVTTNKGEVFTTSLRFASREEAEGSVQAFARRWALARDPRVVETNDPVNCTRVGDQDAFSRLIFNEGKQ